MTQPLQDPSEPDLSIAICIRHRANLVRSSVAELVNQV